MQAMPSIVEADRRCHHTSDDAQMGRLFPDDSIGRAADSNPRSSLLSRQTGEMNLTTPMLAALGAL